MKDFLGNTLAIYDEVVLMAPEYRLLTKGVIYAFTKTKVRISYINKWNHINGVVCEILQEPSQIIKVIQHGDS